MDSVKLNRGLISGGSLDNAGFARDVADKIKLKMREVAGRSGEKIPYTAANGVFDDQTQKNICWWTNGFWGGMMWQLFNATGEELFKEKALKNEEQLDADLMIAAGLDHDNGFKWLPTAGADHTITGSKAAFNRLRLAADNLLGRFNLAGSFFRAWNDDDGLRAGWAIIDCMMNLPLLYRMSDYLNDPRYRLAAVKHADTAIKYFVREDGSVNHIVEFDPATGEFIKTQGGQGMAVGSTWTRGQAWAVYGFTLSYIHTGEQRFLDTAVKAADFFTGHLKDADRITVPVDFSQPGEIEWEDGTAAAIASCGLLELSGILGEKGAKYRSFADRLLKTLADSRTDWDPATDNLLTKCTAAYHDKNHDFPIIYGDYFFIEAIFKLTGEELFIW
ncbi:MAG: glycoside hydrolase family 88 protein [Lachnospiraceae bacterium]|nr:glycoside hydrolase family 88 protein [Lachnospiraceae bacterium]